LVKKKDMLDPAGKIIFQTSDQNVGAKRILTELENGEIITTALLTRARRSPPACPSVRSPSSTKRRTRSSNIAEETGEFPRDFHGPGAALPS
jgi:hypothetical protein